MEGGSKAKRRMLMKPSSVVQELGKKKLGGQPPEEQEKSKKQMGEREVQSMGKRVWSSYHGDADGCQVQMDPHAQRQWKGYAAAGSAHSCPVLHLLPPPAQLKPNSAAAALLMMMDGCL